MSYTLGTAATATGKSKPTIQRAIKAGKISASKDENGAYQIDPAELHRVYPAVIRNTTECVTKDDMKRDVTPKSNGETPKQGDGTLKKILVTADLVKEMGRLRGELEAIKTASERERSLLSSQVEDLRERLDSSEAERRQKTEQLTALLAAPTPEPRKGFFRRLFAS